MIKYLFFARALHLQGFATNNSIELQLGAHNKTFVKKICEIFRSVFTLWYRRLLRYWRERIRIPKVPPPPTTRTTILIKLGAPRHFFPLLSLSPPKGFFKIGIFSSRHHSTDVKRLIYRGKIRAKKIHHFENPRKIMLPAWCACKMCEFVKSLTISPPGCDTFGTSCAGQVNVAFRGVIELLPSGVFIFSSSTRSGISIICQS